MLTTIISGVATPKYNLYAERSFAIAVVNVGPVESSTRRIPKNAFTFSTCSVVNGPPYFSFPQVKPGRKLILTVGEGTATNGITMFFGKL